VRVYGTADRPKVVTLNLIAELGLSSRKGGWHGSREGRDICSPGSTRGSAGWVLSPGLGDRVEGYLERTARAKFHLAIAYPPSMRLGRLYRHAVTRKAALAAFEAFAVEALKTVDVSRTETKHWS
jgi:hypothetical protein